MNSLSSAKLIPHLHNLHAGIKDRKPGEKLRGMEERTLLNTDGTVVTTHVFDSKKKDDVKESVLERLKNVFDGGHKAMRAELKTALKEADRYAGHRRDVQKAMKGVRRELGRTRLGHNIRVDKIKLYLVVIDDALQAEDWFQAETRGLVMTPTLASLPDLNLKLNGEQYADALKEAAGGNMKPLVNTIIEDVRRGLAQADPKTRLSLTLSGAQFKQEMILDLTARALPGTDQSALENAVKEGYFKGVCQDIPLQGNMPGQFQANGKAYVRSNDPNDKLGAGANGDVAVFTCGGEKVVLKRVMEGGVHESLLQLAAHQACPDGTTKLLDVIRLKDGSVGMVLRYAPNGHLMPDPDFETRKKLTEEFVESAVGVAPVERDAQGEAEIAQVCRDVQTLHDNDISICDLKPANVLRGKKHHGGHALEITDYGTARFTTNTDQGKMRPAPTGVQCPNWRAPEIGRAIARWKKRREPIDEKIYKLKEDKAVARQNKDTNKVKQLEEALRLENINLNKVEIESINGPAADSWSLGCMLYQKYAGIWPFTREVIDQQFTDDANVVEDYCDPNKTPEERDNFLFGNRKIPNEVKEIIKAALDPDPQKRITPKQIADRLEGRPMQLPELSSLKTRPHRGKVRA